METQRDRQTIEDYKRQTLTNVEIGRMTFVELQRDDPFAGCWRIRRISREKRHEPRNVTISNVANF